jgi:hypothetical protein
MGRVGEAPAWTSEVGCGASARYKAAFRKNEIDDTVLPNLTAGDLKDLGVGIVGHCCQAADACLYRLENVRARDFSPETGPTSDPAFHAAKKSLMVERSSCMERANP